MTPGPLPELSLGAAYDYLGNGSTGGSSYGNAISLYASYQATEKLKLNVRGEYATSDYNAFLPVSDWLLNCRAWLTGIAGREHAVFVRRDAFLDVGGFTQTPEHENIELCRRLKDISRPLRLHQSVVAPAGGRLPYKPRSLKDG